MSIKDRLNHELKAIVRVTLFFAAWLGVFMGLKVLIREDTGSDNDTFTIGCSLQW